MLGARARWSAPRSVGMIGVKEVGDEAGGAQVAGDGRHPGRKPVIVRPGLDRLALLDFLAVQGALLAGPTCPCREPSPAPRTHTRENKMTVTEGRRSAD